MSTLSNVMSAGAFLPPMIQALHSFHGVWQRVGTFGRDFKDIRDTLRVEECRFGEVLNCDLQSLAKIGDPVQTVQAVNRQVANIQSHLDSCHEFINRYDGGAATEDPEQQAADSEALQSATGFPRRARWAIIDWQKLNSSLEHIRISIDGLHSLLRLEYSYSPRASSAKQKTAANSALLPVRKALSRLHHGLAGLNDASQPDNQLSIQLREHWDSTSEEFSGLADLEVRDGSYVFSIQKSVSSDPKTDSILLLVDTPKEIPDSQGEDSMTTNLPRMTDLDGPKGTATSSTSDQRSRIETWGYFPTPQRRSISKDLHIVHRATSSWRSPLHLADILSNPSYVEHITPIEITWLAKLLVTSHLCFLPVQRELNVQPRPSNYRFYCKPEDEFDPWADGNPLVLKPFLSIGFGTSRKSIFGAVSEFNHPPYASVMELGLVLYQIGSGRVVNYGAGRAGFAQAKAKILRELDRDSSVDAIAGSSYVSIIEGCLHMWTKFRLCNDDLAAMQRREEEYLWEVVAQLSDDLQQLEDTVLSESGRASLITSETISVPELIPASNNQSQAMMAADLAKTGQDQRGLIDMPVSTDVEAANLDSPRITEGVKENRILRKLRSLTERCGARPQSSNILKWSRTRGGQTLSVLECPFSRLGCDLRYSDLTAWFWHTLTHFYISDQFPRTVIPPTTNTYCIYGKRFTAIRGIDSWQQLLAHNAFHHLHEDSVVDAVPDIELYTYLWHNGLIDEVLYKEIKGLPKDAEFPVHKISSVDAVAPALLGSETRPVTVLTERRFGRFGGRRGLGWLRGR